jgi:long-chain acyl-CoA synthetase
VLHCPKTSPNGSPQSSSECGGIGYDESDEPIYEEGYVGTPMRGIEVKREGEGETAPIAVRSAAVGEGYWPEPDEAMLGNGRFVPGDLIGWKERGMFIVGRSTDLINIAGRKLNPVEVEERLLDCPGVEQAIVFGIPSPLRGEEAIACVAGKGIDPAAVMDFCRRSLSSWQIPRDVWVLPEIATNERGKVSRRHLAAVYQQQHPQRL